MSDKDEIERQRFEYWASDKGQYPRAVEKRGNKYLFLTAQNQWEAWQAAWQASRAALVFEFPNYECAGTLQSDIWNDCLERCENAVKSEGISVKDG
ncbi:Phage protein [Sodalis praecaptivus]|uniref:Phage protein n=1 Tax=Sodalis praecaptivus TaxID=1239307 RepID=W0HVR9_9GAMM|nr:hypothetical protein [Sodalis praecaptivus]AHF77926.1 Phage protein [Sodalis praecaptivus]